MARTDHLSYWPLAAAVRFRGLLGILIATFALGFPCQVDADGADNSSVATELMRMLDDGDIDAAVDAVSQIEVSSAVSSRTLAAIIQTARKCSSEGRNEDAADVYHTAAAICGKLSADSPAELPAEKAVAIWHAAASGLTVVGRDAEALRWLRLAAKASTNPYAGQRVGDALLAVASGALNGADKLTAGHAYQLAIELFEKSEAEHPSPSMATARLGYAWTLVMAASESGNADHIRQSLIAVDEFLQRHPDHDDASSALLLKLSCQTRLGEHDAADSTRDEIMQKHPRTEAMCEVVQLACAVRGDDGEPAPLGEPIRQYLVEHYDYVLASRRLRANLDVVKAALIAAAVAGSPEAEIGYAVALSLCDQVGDAATSALEELHQNGHDAAAQRIAMRWLSARDESTAQPNSVIAKMQNQSGMLITGPVREAACRWAGRTGLWSMLAMAAEEEPGLYASTSDSSAEDEAYRRGRSLHVERLFAEALLQTGKTKQSLKLWERIVDGHGADDFPTLLRLAETAVAVGSVTQASTRIVAAQSAAMQQGTATGGNGNSSPEVALTNLLAASLEVRQLNFDRARGLLERVVRSSRADTDVRGRAQWLIGETFFMQEKFVDAIAAYRQVEAIGSSDQWTAAALVQAGKSFEQLGRTREATVCYSTLVSRFGDSPHAGGARRRLAAMTSGGSSAPSTIRR
ncbi:tetratricopeptide repeat protein [Aporhodopirellula aestuarii]|uniref:Tetratricopeptide repeat protein n=1 Tax=Aporhodopirellula aestuarii TaxID=2950107 RepID=A0ABT0UC14_9BACT|nr:tetratricopeptide repeat protein [Aporhodopirellula aestuarii]MCM2374357.1 hypothetical protein [Aporhodopirellula aestuarii]